MRLNLTRTDALLAGAAALLVLLYVAAAGGGFPLDDAWIHQTYARNLGTRGEWAFVPGEPSAASTSPLYTVLLATGYALRIPYPLWTHGLGAVALAAAGMLAARMARRLAPEVRGIGLAAGLAVVFSWHLVWAAAAGMETMLFSLWTLALLALAWRELDARSLAMRHVLLRGVSFGVVSALAFLTRPEGLALVGLIGLSMIVVRPQGSWRGLLLWGLGAALGFAVTSAPYLAYNLRLTGGLLPDTAAAKQAEYAALLALPYLTRLGNMVYPLLAGAHILLLPGAAYYVALQVQRLATRREVVFYLLPLAWSITLIALYAARLPANYQHGRYVIPALPAYVLCAVVGMAWLLRLRRTSMVTRVLTRTLALSAALVMLYFVLVSGVLAYRQDVRIIEEEMVTAARWIAANVPPDELLVVHDIGAVGYFAPRPIFDLAGLVSPEVVPVIRDSESLWAMMEQRNARYLMGFPDHIPGQDTDDARLCLVFDTQGATGRSVGQPNMAVYELTWNDGCK